MSYDYYVDPELDEDAFAGIPKGERFLKVIEHEDAGVTKNGDSMIRLKLEDTVTGRTMLHWLVLLPKGNLGAGITKKWLKTLMGASIEGNISIDPDKWLGVVFKGTVYYEKARDSDKEYPRIMTSSLKSLGEDEEVPEKPVLNEDIPFALLLTLSVSMLYLL